MGVFRWRCRCEPPKYSASGHLKVKQHVSRHSWSWNSTHGDLSLEHGYSSNVLDTLPMKSHVLIPLATLSDLERRISELGEETNEVKLSNFNRVVQLN